jgi:precorrin isomerase
LELDGLRVVHACWDYDAVEFLAMHREGVEDDP